MRQADIKIQELNDQENITQTQFRALNEVVTLSSKLLEHHIEQIDHVLYSYSSLTVLVSDVVARLHVIGALIDKLSISAKNGQLDIITMTQLFDVPEVRKVLLEITPDSLDRKSLKFLALDTHSVQLQFRAHPK